MINKQLYHFFIFFIVVSILSCDEGSDDPIPNNQNANSTITFSPATASWYLRQYPDSVAINISNGNPPYVITTRPDFSCEAIVQNNQLVLYPKHPNSSRLGKDFVVIQDNNGNVNSFNIEVESLDHSYDSIVEFSIDVTGDTNFSMDASQFGIKWGRWDEYSKELNSGISTPGLVQIVLKNVSNTGLVSFTHKNNVLILSDPTLPFNERFEFILNDLNQSAKISLLNRNEFKIEAEVDLINTNNKFTGVHLAKLKVHAMKK